MKIQSALNQIRERVNKIWERLEHVELVEARQSKLLTFGEAAVYMRISRSYLYKLTAKREIPFLRPHGKLIYFEKSDLDAWLRRNRVKSQAELEA